MKTQIMKNGIVKKNTMRREMRRPPNYAKTRQMKDWKASYIVTNE